MSSIKQTNCALCAFANWVEKDGKQIQIGCNVGQLDNYKSFKQRVDPNGHDADNAVFKIEEMDNKRAYLINYACVFQRHPGWLEQVKEAELWPETPVEQREFVFKTIPFQYGLVVISDGHVRSTLKTCKSVCNGTVPPRWVEIVNRPKYNTKKFIEEIILAIRDRMGKDINIPPEDAKNAANFINFRQLADNFPEHTKEMALEAIKDRQGYFWVLVLQANTKIDPEFIESIKHQVIDNFLDFHVLSLSPDEAMLVQPVFAGGAEFAPHACFIMKGANLVQEYKIDYIREFFTIVD